MPTGILDLKLGSSVNMPTKRLHALLSESSIACNLARNAMLRHWERWREDNPDWKPEQRRKRDGSPKELKDGRPALEDLAVSQAMENELYYRGRALAPAVAAKVVASCRAEVVKYLKADMPYNHDGKAKKRWQAILSYEVSAPAFRAEVLPVPNQDTKLVYNESGCTLEFPLLSHQSGYATTKPLCRLEVRQLSRGNRRLVKRVADGGLKLKDSKLVFKRGAWFFALTYDAPVVDHGLDAARKATLTPLPSTADRPFEIRFPEEQDAEGKAFSRKWKLGDGQVLEFGYRRLLLRRKAIQNRYKDGANKGHGRNPCYQATRPASRAMRDMQDRFVKHLVADIVRACVKNDCGSILYREPTMPLRAKLWFEERGLPFDWTEFAGRLKFKLETNAIKQEKTVRIGMAQHQEEYEWGRGAKKPVAAREVESHSGNGHAESTNGNGHAAKAKNGKPLAKRHGKPVLA